VSTGVENFTSPIEQGQSQQVTANRATKLGNCALNVKIKFPFGAVVSMFFALTGEGDA
jgi:hypothetical protein